MSWSRSLVLLVFAACGRVGFDATADGSVAMPDMAPGELSHVEVMAGWTVEVFHDFSAKHMYRAEDFVDGTEVYENLPTSLFVLEAPFPRVLGMTAGRAFIEIGATEYIVHDYGDHPPDTPDLPDGLLNGTYVPNLDNNGPALLLASASNGSGDGTFRVKPDYSISTDLNRNNTRAVIWDDGGVFDSRGAGEAYLFTQAGVERRSDINGVALGDTASGRIVGSDLVFARIVPDAPDELVLVATMTHAESILHSGEFLEVAAGAPAPYVALVIESFRELLAFRTGGIDRIAKTLDASYVWEGAAAPPATHPLGGSKVYVLESNRELDIDRILVLTAP